MLIVGEVQAVSNLYKTAGRSPRCARVGLLSGSAIGLGAALPPWPFGPWSGGPALLRTTPVRLTRRRTLDSIMNTGDFCRTLFISSRTLFVFVNFRTF